VRIFLRCCFIRYLFGSVKIDSVQLFIIIIIVIRNFYWLKSQNTNLDSFPPVFYCYFITDRTRLRDRAEDSLKQLILCS